MALYVILLQNDMCYLQIHFMIIFFMIILNVIGVACNGERLARCEEHLMASPRIIRMWSYNSIKLLL